ncbi:hypothetical protein MTR_2g067910 [Medicago truncatula]|uniref:Uncharacterized protein n=1 Tax=Medicago truncatula TaxID=3880 RepID=A0A072VJL6_MEDTR|nr:hypothetical protein MTR_2g067910 [Medicago truncatula]
MCLGLIPNHFVLLLLKDDDPLPPSSMEWNNHKSEEAASWEDEFLDQRDRFQTLMNLERGEKPLSPKKDSNQHNAVFCDTPVKANEEFEDLVEHLDDLISLDEILYFFVDKNRPKMAGNDIADCAVFLLLVCAVW